MLITNAFDTFCKKLESRYDPREAYLIASYIFEDIFMLKLPLSSSKEFTEAEMQLLEKVTARLLEGEPWQYIAGAADFFGYKFKVGPAVLIPRPETEELVYWILQTNKPQAAQKPFKILDIGTGSGCIALSLAKEMPTAELHALDISRAALQIAEENAAKLGVSVRFWQMDILNEEKWEDLPVFDLIVSNPPYITANEKKDLSKHVVDFEPNEALFTTSDDPLQFYKAIARFAQTAHLKPGGSLYFELSALFAMETYNLLESMDFEGLELKKDLQGNLRMLKGVVSDELRVES